MLHLQIVWKASEKKSDRLSLELDDGQSTNTIVERNFLAGESEESGVEYHKVIPDHKADAHFALYSNFDSGEVR